MFEELTFLVEVFDGVGVVGARAIHELVEVVRQSLLGLLKALDWFWLIDETLSANLVYQDDYEIGSTTPSDEAITKIMIMVIAW